MALDHGHVPLSYDDYARLPDEPRGEVFEGAFFMTPSPSPRHQDLVGDIFVAIKQWLRRQPDVGRAFVAPLDVVLRAERPATIVQPDVFFVSAARAGIVQDAVRGAPDLVVEVVSPTGAGRDAVTKRALYARHGVRELWLVWPAEMRVDVLLAAEGGDFGEVRTLHPGAALTSDLLPGFTLDLTDLFQPPPGNT